MIVLESRGNKLQKEEQAIYDVLTKRGTHEVVEVPLKHLQRGRFRVPADALVVSGSILFVHAALKQLGCEIPATDSYPECVKPFLRREITTGTVQDLRLDKLPLFIKPAKRTKQFTGFVCHDPDDYRLRGVSKHAQLYFSEVVEWNSEYRIYLYGKNSLDIAEYYRSEYGSYELDTRVLREMVDALDINYPTVIDVGVLDDLKTAVVEVNDFYSVGLYNDQDDVYVVNYVDAVVERWQQLSGQK